MTSPPQFRRILYQVDGAVATITLNEPDLLNPIRYGPDGNVREILEALEIADADAEVRCVVLTGSGRAFSSGGQGDPAGRQARFGPQSTADVHQYLSQVQLEDLERLRKNNKPIIGAINGLCFGAGLLLAAHLDFLVAVDEATFCMIEVRYGGPGADVLPFIVGPQWAKFLILTGEKISAQRAREIGLVLEVFPAEIFPAKVQDLARRIASIPPHAVYLNRRLINSAMNVLGWLAQKELAVPMDAIITSLEGEARTVDGRDLRQIRRDEGWKAYKAARDEPFADPWLP